MSFEQDFITMVKDNCEELGQTMVSQITGVSQQNLSRIVTGEIGAKGPGLKIVGAVIDKLYGSDAIPVIKRAYTNAPVEEVRGSGLPTVPVYGSTGAGDPQEFWNQEPERQIEVLPQYAKPGCVALRVDGDSMEPTINRGAYVGVVPLNGSISEGGIYLVNVAPFGRLIKRIRMGEANSIELVSDNRKYPPRSLPLEQYEAVVVGRVAWVWQEL